MQFINTTHTAFAALILGLLACPCGNLAWGQDYPLSQPLDETLMVHEQLTSGESDEVPPEPAPPNEYQPLDAQAPALVAEEILRLRDALGTSPLSGRQGFRPLTLANESDEDQATPAPWEREDDRRDFRDRLRGMASRPILPQPLGVPYGAMPYHANPPAFVTHPVPHVYMQPPSVPVPYRYEPAPCYEAARETYVSPFIAPVHTADEMQEQKQIDILRQTAHQLDETAHQLECCEQFERADQVRQLAESLRQDARKGHRAGASTAMGSVRPAAVCAEHSLRAAMRTRSAQRGEVDACESESLDCEPSCPACPLLRTAPPADQQTPLGRKLPNQKLFDAQPDSSEVPAGTPY